MKIKLPVIGIPAWSWKGELIRFADANPRIIEVENNQLDYECGRHYEILKAFDKGGSCLPTEYVRFLRFVGKDGDAIEKKIKRFKALYSSIREQGLLPDKLPIITGDGVRLNGSHRIAIAVHLGIKEIRINLAKYSDLYSGKKLAEILKQVEDCRKMKLEPGYLENHRY